MKSNLDVYISQLKSLRVKKINGYAAPHKAILLLSIFSLIEENVITENKIFISDELKDKFNLLWDTYIGFSLTYNPKVWTPYWHLIHESFWHFQKKESYEGNIIDLVPKGETASKGKMVRAIEYAYIDNDLYELLTNHDSNSQLSSILIKSYLS